jgi:hypothetical protein
MDGYPKTAACACGALTVTVSSPPAMVHACSCLSCQRRSGSAFTYTAFFVESETAVNGETTPWRRNSEAGRFHETNFCPTCGCTAFYRLEALPGMICVPAGTFADPSFAKPAKLYWSAHSHQWLTPFGYIATVERQ